MSTEGSPDSHREQLAMTSISPRATSPRQLLQQLARSQHRQPVLLFHIGIVRYDGINVTRRQGRIILDGVLQVIPSAVKRMEHVLRFQSAQFHRL